MTSPVPRGQRTLQTIATPADAHASGDTPLRKRVHSVRRILALLLMVGAPAAAEGVVLPGLFAVAGVAPGDVLNVRDAPDAGAAIVGRLGPGAQDVEVVAVDASGGWGQVNTGERAGWVAMRFLRAGPEAWAPGALPATLRCFGTEPFWSLTPTTFSTPDAPDRPLRLVAALDTGLPGDPRRALVARDGTDRLTAFIAPGRCSDGMSDRAYGLTVAVVRDGVREGEADARLLTGCCSIAPR